MNNTHIEYVKAFRLAILNPFHLSECVRVTVLDYTLAQQQRQPELTHAQVENVLTNRMCNFDNNHLLV